MGSKQSSLVMETNPSKKTPGVSLPSDVLVVVLESLNHMSRHKFSRLRLVSRQFDALVVPIMYRHLVLTKGLVACFGRDIDDEAQLQVAQDARHYSKGVSINDNRLNWRMVRELLRSLGDVRYLSWSIMKPYSSFVFEGTSCILPILRQRWPDAKLALAVSTYMMENTMELPLPQLASFKIVDNSEAGYLDLTAVKKSFSQFLEASPNLRRLHLVAGATFTYVNTQIPTIHELVLGNYDWRPGSSLYWNFSSLTHLELKKMALWGFLEDIRPAQLPQLRSFKTDTCTRYPACDSESFCRWTRELIALETLEFRCTLEVADYLSVIKKHALTLQTLDLKYDTTYGICDRGTWHWQLANALLTMSESSLRLRQLTLNIGSSSDLSCHDDRELALSTPGAKNILALFRDLRYLTVVAVQPYLAGKQPNLERNHSTRRAARGWIEGLVAAKIGVRFEQVIVKVPLETTSGPCSYEDRGLAHSTYTYEGVRHEDDTLSIREDMHEHFQQYAEK